jgi:Holliday junction resolvase RusA-like endonuclease
MNAGTAAAVQEVCFVIPLTPPSVNHYKTRTRRGVTFVSDEAKAYKAAVAMFARRQSMCAGLTTTQLGKLHYELEVTVYFGKGQKGDGDNLWKCVGDGLKEAGVIHSDAAVSDWIMRVRRDWLNPRTEIAVRAAVPE